MWPRLYSNLKIGTDTPQTAIRVEGRPIITIQMVDNGFVVQLGDSTHFAESVTSATVCSTLEDLTAEVVRIVAVSKLKGT